MVFSPFSLIAIFAVGKQLMICEANMMEHCRNPWKNSCKSENIKLYIELKGEKLPICKRCWSHLADKEICWGD
jgi:hypothetical protein